nr:hypothetical protein [archaeon]
MAAKKNKLDTLPQEIPDETKKKLEAIKSKLDKFKDKVLAKFEDYVVGISLLPPDKDAKNKEKINVLVLVDDSDSTKMPKGELKEKLTKIIGKIGEDTDKNLAPDVVIITELWQSCYDAKYELLQMIALSAPVYDKGMLA